MYGRQSRQRTSSSRGCWNRWGGSCVLVILVGPLVYYGLFFALRGPLPRNPQLIAHRGGPAYEPENTLAAFQNAVAVGADWIEMDVQRSHDGALMVIHDEKVNRTTDGTGRVGDLTLERIRALDAGNGERVPTFEEVIALAREAGIGLLPEAKSPDLYPGIEADMARALAEGSYADRTVVQSFEPDALERIQEIDSDLQVCPLYGLWTLDLSRPRPSEASVLCPMAEMVVLNPWMIRQAHAQGRQVFVWFGVIEHPVVMRFLLALGADGLMVDDPIALARVLGR
jgi:glycerophosphoryl diester phosphodiesterase